MKKPDNKETDTFSFFREKSQTKVFWNLVYSQKKPLAELQESYLELKTSEQIRSVEIKSSE